MNPARRRRMMLAGALAVSAAALGLIAFGNMGENLVYYWEPTQLEAAGSDAYGATVRLGGMVQTGTVDWDEADNSLKFSVTDGAATVQVRSTGAPPQMFREGIGVVVEGTLSEGGVFVSDRLMVKHSNEYRAPVEGVDSKELYRTVEDL